MRRRIVNKLYKLRSFGYVVIDNDIWFLNCYFNALIKINKLSGKIEVIEKTPGYNVREKRLYRMVCYVDGKLIFVPGRSERVVSYDIGTGEFSSCYLDVDKVGERKPYFWNAYVYYNYVYMFPRKAKCIIKYDIVKNTIKYLENSLNKVPDFLSEESACFVKQFEIIEEKIYIPFERLNAVAVFDIGNENLDIKYLNIKEGCSTINYVDGYFYLASCTSPVLYRWDVETGRVWTYDFPEEFQAGRSPMFFEAIKMEDRLIFFPFHCDIIISFDINAKRFTIEQRNLEMEENDAGVTYFIEKNKGQNHSFLADVNGLCSINYEGGKLKISPYFCQDDLYNKKQINKFLLKNSYFDAYFEGEVTLEEYVEVLENADNKLVFEKESLYGKLIFDQLQKR